MAEELQKILGDDDDVISNLVINFLDTPDVDPRIIHINLSGFLESKTTKFVESLWKLLLSAQTTPNGIPQKILDDKKKELAENNVIINISLHLSIDSHLSFPSLKTMLSISQIDHEKVAMAIKKIQELSHLKRSDTHKGKLNFPIKHSSKLALIL